MARDRGHERMSSWKAPDPGRQRLPVLIVETKPAPQSTVASQPPAMAVIVPRTLASLGRVASAVLATATRSPTAGV